MRSILQSRLLLSLISALACAPLVGCVGEIRKGTYVDNSEAGATPGPDSSPSHVDDRAQADAASRPNPPAGNPHDGGASASADTGAAAADAGPVMQPPVGGARDAQVAVDTGTPPHPKQTPVFVVVGSSGVRLVSRDLGKTWGNIVTSGGSGDDQNLLRGVAYGNGLFVAAGWRIWTSTDAVSWTERTNPSKQWEGGLEFGNNRFVGAGGSGSSIYSTDGITWMAGKDRNSEAGRSVAFGNGMFLAGTDANNWWTTTDGNTWTVLSGGHNTNQVMWCGNKFSEPADCTDPLARNNGQTAFGAGVWVSAGSGYIERSEDGKTWTKTQDTSAYPVEGVTFGYVNN
ncbi:MAG: hypothetical protein JWN04_5541 [Myxococcaceae bacterium]|nr:hypothetical protein [Myxococcaceae bacterium]